ncbi:MAG: hypothetical protein OEW84_04870 [Aigarchaeota archaeon]|nr:hypothetical protein [Aigarchaeota archaeon]
MGEVSVGTVIVAFTVIGIGIAAWALGLSRTSIAASDLTRETGKAVLQEASLFVFEDVKFYGSTIYVRLYNVGSIPLQIISIVLSTPTNPKTFDFQDLGTLDIQESRVFQLNGKREQGLTIRVYALATQLFDPDDVTLNIQWGVDDVWKE